MTETLLSLPAGVFDDGLREQRESDRLHCAGTLASEVALPGMVASKLVTSGVHLLL